MVHKGLLTELSFETEKLKRSLRQSEFFLTCSRMKTSLEELNKSANIRLGANYSYNVLILQRNNFHYYLGPENSLCYSFSLFPNWDESHSYWADYISLEANNVFFVTLRQEREWLASLNFSVFSFFSRPDEIRSYKIDESTSGGILRAINSSIENGPMNRALLAGWELIGIYAI
jgi:hypothetical protein